MGSLMSGWDSHSPHPNVVKYRRNKSLTKEEIESFWKSKKLKEEEHLRDISLLSPRTQKKVFEEAVERADSDQPLQKNGWWISSNWAFLNEAPVLIGPQGSPAQKYTSQHHVAGSV